MSVRAEDRIYSAGALKSRELLIGIGGVIVRCHDYRVTFGCLSEVCCNILYNVNRVNKIVVLDVSCKNARFLIVAHDTDNADLHALLFNDRICIDPIRASGGALEIDISAEEGEVCLSVGWVAVGICGDLVDSPVKLVVTEYKAVNARCVQRLNHRSTIGFTAYVRALEGVTVVNENVVAVRYLK